MGHNSVATCRATPICLHGNLNNNTSMRTKFGENRYSGVGEIALKRFKEFSVIRGHNSENACGTKIISINANLHMNTSMCTLKIRQAV